MDSPIDASDPLLSQLLWASDPATRSAILVVLGAGLLALLLVYAPLLIRLARLALLERAVRAACRADERRPGQHREEIAAAFSSSPLARQWEEFVYRWKGARAEGSPRERSPVRLLDVLDERPLLPSGARRSLLPALPGLFLAIGILGTFVGLTAAVSGGALGEPELERSQLVGLLANQIGLALRTSLWGLILCVASVVVGRLLEGSFERCGEALDRDVERAFGSLSAGELANLAALAQRRTLEQLGAELTRFTNDLSERLDRGLHRIERSTAAAANLVSEEQRSILQAVVRELSLQVQQGVEQHLGALHSLLDRSVEHQGAVTGGLAASFEQMQENSQVHARVTHELERAATAMKTAAGSISGTAHDFTPVLEHLRDTSRALGQTSEQMESTQHVVSRSADGVRLSLEHAADALQQQRDFVESGLGEIRGTLELLSSGLGEHLTQALRSVDDALAHTVGRLREAISESNETIDRMAAPVRAAEGTTREMHTALERVRSELVGLGDWLTQALKPMRHTLGQLDDRTGEITRALVGFGDTTHAVDKTMDALRGEIHDEGRRFRAATAEFGRRLEQASSTLLMLEETAVAEQYTRTSESASGTPQATCDPGEATPPPSAAASGMSQPETLRPPPPATTLDPVARTHEATHVEPRTPQAQPVRSTESAGTGSTGRALGPDPYSRLEVERAEWERAYLSLPSAGLPEFESAAGPPADSSDELRLSGLLSPRPTDPPSPVTPLQETADEIETAGSDSSEAAPEATRPSEPAGSVEEARHPPRSWRFLGKD